MPRQPSVWLHFWPLRVWLALLSAPAAPRVEVRAICPPQLLLRRRTRRHQPPLPPLAARTPGLARCTPQPWLGHPSLCPVLRPLRRCAQASSARATPRWLGGAPVSSSSPRPTRTAAAAAAHGAGAAGKPFRPQPGPAGASSPGSGPQPGGPPACRRPRLPGGHCCPGPREPLPRPPSTASRPCRTGQRPRILQWNCNHLGPCNAELADHLLREQLDVAALREAYVFVGCLHLPGYVCHPSTTSCRLRSCSDHPCLDASHRPGKFHVVVYVRAALNSPGRPGLSQAGPHALRRCHGAHGVHGHRRGQRLRAATISLGRHSTASTSGTPWP